MAATQMATKQFCNTKLSTAFPSPDNRCPYRTEITNAGLVVNTSVISYTTTQLVQEQHILTTKTGTASLVAKGTGLQNSSLAIDSCYISVGTSSGTISSVSFPNSMPVPANGTTAAQNVNFSFTPNGTINGGTAGIGNITGTIPRIISTNLRIGHGPNTLVDVTSVGMSVTIPNNIPYSSSYDLNMQLNISVDAPGGGAPANNLTLTITGPLGSQNANSISTNIGSFSVNNGGGGSSSYLISSPITWFSVFGGANTTQIELTCSNGGSIATFAYVTGQTYNSTNKPSTWWNHVIGTHTLTVKFS